MKMMIFKLFTLKKRSLVFEVFLICLISRILGIYIWEISNRSWLLWIEMKMKSMKFFNNLGSFQTKALENRSTLRSLFKWCRLLNVKSWSKKDVYRKKMMIHFNCWQKKNDRNTNGSFLEQAFINLLLFSQIKKLLISWDF